MDFQIGASKWRQIKATGYHLQSLVIGISI